MTWLNYAQKKCMSNFPMAKDQFANSTLQAITEESLIFLLQNTDPSKIHSILLTGSLANAEGTVVNNTSQIVASDFDFEVYIDTFYFLLHKSLFHNLSRKMTKKLLSRGINTHVEYQPSNPCLESILSFLNSKIYEYEFALASKCVFGRPPVFDMTARPTKAEALELTFTVAGDIVFSEDTKNSDTELSYVYAKRALTLLNSLLIFNGIFAESYQKRLDAGVEYSEKLKCLSAEDLSMLRTFTEFKLSGSIVKTMATLKCISVTDLVKREKEYLKSLTTRVLLYEIANLETEYGENLLYCSNDGKLSLEDCTTLLNQYLKNNNTRLIPRLLGVVLYLLSLVKRENEKSELFKVFLLRKQSPKIIMNYLIASVLIRDSFPACPVLRFVLPWIKLNKSGYSKTYSMWKIAQESIKL
jgi:hypothetical protein